MTIRTPEQIAEYLYPSYDAFGGIREAATVGAREAQLGNLVTAPQYVIIRGGVAVETSEHIVVLDLDMDGCDLWAGKQLLTTAEKLLAGGAPVQEQVDFLRAWVAETRAHGRQDEDLVRRLGHQADLGLILSREDSASPVDFEWRVWIAASPESGHETFSTESEAFASASDNMRWRSNWAREVAVRRIYQPGPWVQLTNRTPPGTGTQLH